MVMKWQHSFVWISSQTDTIEGKCPTLLPVLNFCLQMAEMKCNGQEFRNTMKNAQ